MLPQLALQGKEGCQEVRTSPSLGTERQKLRDKSRGRHRDRERESRETVKSRDTVKERDTGLKREMENVGEDKSCSELQRHT